MYTTKDIKPIPKYIINLIEKRDKESIKYHYIPNRFYSYLTRYKNEILQVIVACKYKGKKLYCKQVAIHGLHANKCFVKDIAYFNIAGYTVGWYAEGLSKYEKWYENNGWDIAEDKHFNPYAPVLNIDYVFRFPQFKYCAVDLVHTTEVLKYLRLYEKYPQMEMVAKFGLTNYIFSKQLLAKTSKDKKFRTWLIQHKDELSTNYFYISTILLSYKTGKPLKETQLFESAKKELQQHDNYRQIKTIIDKSEYTKLIEYITKQNTNLSSYSDYISACNHLDIDLQLDKNKFPHNFQHWHDVRIDQYHTKLAEEDEERRKSLYNQFSLVADKYLPLQRNLKDNFVVVIAKSPKDLINEGNILHHCVGSYNYDQKFAREESLIFFVRNKDNIQTPFVTLEYSLDKHKVLQCYGEHDTKPADEVLNFVYKIWLPYANRKIRKIAI